MAQNARTNKGSMPMANIKVVGVGGGGGNAISRMHKDFIRGVEFLAINTDHQDLDHCVAKKKIYIGRNLTRGLGTGMNPELGRQAAEENRSDIAEALKGADLVFIAAGLGGGTGTGGAPVVAEIAKQNGSLTLAFVTRPFAFEGSQRERIAQEGVAKLKEKVDALIVVPNDRVFSIISKDTPITKAFEAIDDILKNALRGIVELIISPGIVNLDFADVKTVLSDAGSAIVGLGLATGQDRAMQAVSQALNSPLLEVNPDGAKGILLGISGRDLKMTEINEAAKMISQTADPSARIIFGAYHDRKLKANQIKIVLIATGFNGSGQGNTLFAPVRQPFFGTQKKEEVPFFDVVEKGVRSERMQAEPAIELDTFTPKKATSVVQENGKSSEKPAATPSKKKDTDIWDIPTFLRKRKR